MKLLICGDSFAADWTVKHSGKGWPNMLEDLFSVTNLAQPGCCEYKILKQLESVNLSLYDKILISHTSPYRIYIKQHPVHYNDPLHKDCDLIYTDIKEHADKNKNLQPIVEYFEKYFDFEYARYMHGLLCEKIQNILFPVQDRALHIVCMHWEGMHQFINMIDVTSIVENNVGLINHLTYSGNTLVYREIINYFNGVDGGI